MNVLKSIFTDFTDFFNIKTKMGRIALFALVLLGAAGLFFLREAPATTDVIQSQIRAVPVATVSSFTEGSSLTLVGVVTAKSRAVILSEVPGRVTAVPVSLGDTVVVGQKIAQLENAAAYASLLQAEGAYEAAVAVSFVSDISVVEAQNIQKSAQDTILNLYRTSYTSVSNIVFNTLDVFYSNPQFSTPGVKVDSGNKAAFLNSERFALNTILNTWRDTSVSLNSADNLPNSLEEIKANTLRIITITDIFISILEQSNTTDTLNGASLASYATSLNAARNSLNATLAAVESASLALDNAKEILSKAELGGTSNTVSVANAQIKQALGSLKAAQANYSKTILRSSIAGRVNSLEVQTGDHVTAFQVIAEIANNGVLEITTYVGQNDSALLAVQQEVRIDGVATGVISTIAPAVNAKTGKVEVKIQTTSDELVNGSTVSIEVVSDTSDKTKSTLIQVPLTAVKFTATAGTIYTIENGVIAEHSVEIGAVRDSYIEITKGITRDMQIVTDARGLRTGEQVKPIEN